MVGALLDEKHREAFGIQFFDRLENLFHDEWRQAQRRLIQQQQFRPPHQRASDRKHLLLAAGQRAAALMRARFQQREQGVDTFQIRVEAVGIVGNDRAHLQILEHRHAREDAPALRRLHDAEPRDLVHRELRDVASLKQNAAVAGAGAAKDRHHQRGLARAVAADQRDDLALIDIETDAVQDRQHAVTGGDVLDGEEGGGHSPTSRATSETSTSGTPR